MVTEIAAASAELLKLINNQASTALQRRIESAREEAHDDVEKFKEALLDRNLVRVNLLLGGLRHGILVRLTDDESERLRAIHPEIDGGSLVALYARARCADLAADCGEIAREGAVK